MRSFTAEELERETGFDRRTIAYYVQEGLIPRVGRRGPRTRYPKLVMDRLLFIRRVREAEEAGEIGPVSLSEMRRLFDGVSPGLIERVAEGSFPVQAAVADTAEPRYRSRASRRVTMDRAWAAMDSSAAPDFVGSRTRMDAPLSESDETEWREASLRETLSELQALARRGQDLEPGSVDHWSRVEISPEITLSVRGIAEEDAPLLESVARELRRLIHGA